MYKIIFVKSIHWVNSSARSSFFEKDIILTKPFQPARADISCSFFEKHIIVQNFLLSEWALARHFSKTLLIDYPALATMAHSAYMAAVCLGID